MVICNIVYDLDDTLSELDSKILKKYENCKAVNVVTDITNLDTSVPTIFYGYRTAVKNCGSVNRSRRQINSSYWWTYSNNEIKSENWIVEFVQQCEQDWFKHIDNGIDVVFDEFDVNDFVSHLNPYPLVHEGNYEIYVADWRDDNIIIHSVKKDTLEYVGINPRDFLNSIHEKLDYKSLSIESATCDLIKKRKPIFLDDLLFANSDEWVGIKEITEHFKNEFSSIVVTRAAVIVYYLKQTKHLRDKFMMYQ